METRPLIAVTHARSCDMPMTHNRPIGYQYLDTLQSVNFLRLHAGPRSERGVGWLEDVEE